MRESSEMQGTKPTGPFPFHSTMSLGFSVMLSPLGQLIAL